MSAQFPPRITNGFNELRTTLRGRQPGGEVKFPPEYAEPVIVDGVRYDYAEAPPSREQPHRAAVSAIPIDGRPEPPRLIAVSSAGDFGAHEQVPFTSFADAFINNWQPKSQPTNLTPPQRARFARGITALLERAKRL